MTNSAGLSKTAPDPIMGLFNDRETASRAYHALFNYGYTKNEITAAISEPHSPEPELEDKTLEGLGIGLALGGVMGALAGGISGIGTSMVMPNLGLTLAGALVTGLIGAGAGGVIGALIGALLGSGIVEEKANHHAEDVGQDKVLIAVIPHSKAEATRIESEWLDRGGKEVIRQ